MALVALAIALGAAGIVAAAVIERPVDIVADLTGQDPAALQEERAEGTTYGAMAAEAGVLEDFRARMLEARKATLDERVAEGRLTREEADAILARIEENMANCDGSGTGERIGQGAGVGFGQGSGSGLGQGARQGGGQGSGRGAMARDGSGSGQGRGNGTCGG